MNALTILGQQQPIDPVGSFYRGAQMREQMDEYGRQRELRNALAQNGAGLLAGDQNALAAIAQYDPAMAFQFQRGHAEEQRAAAGERRADATLDLNRRSTESAIADRQARLKILEDQAAREIAQASEQDRLSTLTTLGKLMPEAEKLQTPEEWDKFFQQADPSAVGQFDNRDTMFAVARGLMRGAGGEQFTLGENQTRFDAQGNVIASGTPKAPDEPTSVQEYRFAQQNGETRPYPQWLNETKKAGATNVNVSTGENGLQKELDGEEAKVWSGYLKTGTVAASNAGDFQVLGELIKVAPQGPLTGRLAEALPGVSSAGDAFNSIVKRVAPTLRAEGSGATSDIEYDGMLRSLPALRNQPEANAMILQIMGAKNQINMERAEIVRQFRNREIDATQARRAMSELDARSIMTPEMRSALAGIGVPGGDAGTAPSGVDADIWGVMTPEERALWQN